MSLVGVGAWLLKLLHFFQRVEPWSKSVIRSHSPPEAPMSLWPKSASSNHDLPSTSTDLT